MVVHRLLFCALLASIVLGGTVPPAHAREGQDRPDYGGIDPQVVAAWEKSGAYFCWFGTYPDHAGLGEHTRKSRPKDPEAVPGFQLSWRLEKGSALQALPAPGVPFVLSIWGKDWKDEHLKGLAHLKQLRLLAFRQTSVTDEGLRELAAFPR
jgi:hypothetical protein